jgi:hypothetical protein
LPAAVPCSLPWPCVLSARTPNCCDTAFVLPIEYGGKQGGGDGEEDEDLFADNNEEDAAAADALKAKAAAAKDKAKGDKPPAKTNIVLDIKGIIYMCTDILHGWTISTEKQGSKHRA